MAQGDILYRASSVWKRLAAGTSGHFLKTQGASADPVWAAVAGSADFVKIAENTPTGTSTTFSSLGSYTHLRILYSCRGDQAATSTAINLTFNADSGNNYDSERVNFSTSASFAEQIGTAFGVIAVATGSTATASYAATGEIVILDYRGTTFFKGATNQSGTLLAQSTGNVNSRVNSVFWRSAAAITSITLTLASGNFVSGSKFTLYGLT
jgi:hypothetical protein